MNWLEQFAVTIILALVNGLVKNPAHAAALKGQLVGLANDIYSIYGLTPPVTEGLGTAQGVQTTQTQA